MEPRKLEQALVGGGESLAGDQKLPVVMARSITIGAATCVFHKDRGILRVEVLQ